MTKKQIDDVRKEIASPYGPPYIKELFAVMLSELEAEQQKTKDLSRRIANGGT